MDSSAKGGDRQEDSPHSSQEGNDDLKALASPSLLPCAREGPVPRRTAPRASGVTE